ncbi:MAG: (d)CMP kinase [bacterium]
MSGGRGPVVAIDGPSGSGKSTLAKGLARALGLVHIDTGAMYRVVGLRAAEEGIDVRDDAALGRLCARLRIHFDRTGQGERILEGDRDVTADIRRPDVSRLASDVSTNASVRSALVEMQRALGRAGGVVLDGRDIGTVVFPDAEVKIYLEADVVERARRRTAELESRGIPEDPHRTLSAMVERDQQDSTRALAPLRPAADAIRLDSTQLDADAVLSRAIELVRERAGERLGA